MPELNPRQFFHGTTAKLEPGDVLQSSSKIGRRIHSPNPEHDVGDGGGDADRVFSAPDEGDAWAFAHSAHKRSYWDNMSYDRGDEHGAFMDRPYVYEVEPQGNVAHRPQEGMPNTPTEVTSDSARVLRRIDVPPPNKELFGGRDTGPAVQGALPGDEPYFSHGFMDSDEAETVHLSTREAFGDLTGRSPERARASAGEAERSYRKRSGHPELFSTDEFVSSDYVTDRHYRSRW